MVADISATSYCLYHNFNKVQVFVYYRHAVCVLVNAAVPFFCSKNKWMCVKINCKQSAPVALFKYTLIPIKKNESVLW